MRREIAPVCVRSMSWVPAWWQWFWLVIGVCAGLVAFGVLLTFPWFQRGLYAPDVCELLAAEAAGEGAGDG